MMRRRTTAEIDELVRVSGFEKIAMEIDYWGMFSVSIARRVVSGSSTPSLDANAMRARARNS